MACVTVTISDDMVLSLRYVTRRLRGLVILFSNAIDVLSNGDLSDLGKRKLIFDWKSMPMKI